MRVNVILNPPSEGGEFADVKLSFISKSGTERTVDLDIGFQPLSDFSDDTSSVSFDFFFISAIVYGTDNLLSREEYSIDGWARDIEICFPVNNLQRWNGSVNQLETLLTFLTGDYWSINFSQIILTPLFRKKTRRWRSLIPSYNLSNYDFASLFSGGLDSLIGIIDQLERLQSGRKGLLVSHYDSNSSGTNADQERLYNFLDQQPGYSNSFEWVQANVSLDTKDTNGIKLNKEPSCRSRSILFIGIAIFCIHPVHNITSLLVPENGVISLNFPLTPSRSSTLSTRTTHPYYFKLLHILFEDIGIVKQVNNPYSLNTKGEMVESCDNTDILQGIYTQAVSCGKRGRKQHWDVRVGTQHCGVCMPCIYRRAALHKLNLDNQLYGIDIFTTGRAILTIEDMPALSDFLKRSFTTKQIKDILLANGSLSMGDMTSFANLIERVRTEIKQWIADKGNDNLRRFAGV